MIDKLFFDYSAAKWHNIAFYKFVNQKEIDLWH